MSRSDAEEALIAGELVITVEASAETVRRLRADGTLTADELLRNVAAGLLLVSSQTSADLIEDLGLEICITLKVK